jgi:predicted dehydrogenase
MLPNPDTIPPPISPPLELFMSDKNGLSRRTVLQSSAFAATALAGVAIPKMVHAADSNEIKVGLVGCGGRGTGAAQNALSVDNGPIKLVAMGDVFENNLQSAHKNITESEALRKKVDVPLDRQFVGFDAYKKVMDCLGPGDVVILATPPSFRWVMFKYAIEKGINVFMEKPVTVDGPTSKKMFALGEESVKKNLKVGVGLMCRHCPARGELFNRIQDGQVGDLNFLRAYRIAGPTASAFSTKKPDGMDELEYQIRRFHSFLWLSGGAVSDFLIHNIDECCWMKNAWPVSARGYGGRHYRGDYVDQNFDVYTLEYTFADGAKFIVEGRCMAGCEQEFASYAHGSKGSAVISQSGHWPSYARMYKNQKISRGTRNNPDILWACAQPEPGNHNPYQVEWDDLINAIRTDKPYNEVKRGVEASLVTSMGRMAAHTGQAVTYDEMLNCEHEFAPGIESLVIGATPPLRSNAQGKYPVPQPGIITDREYVEFS